MVKPTPHQGHASWKQDMSSATILYSGKTAGKFLRALSHMNIASVTE